MKKKVLFIIWSYTSGGGAESQLVNLVNNLNSKKYDIDVIEFFHTNIFIPNFNANINELPPFNNKENESKIKRLLINIFIYIFPQIVRKIYIKKTYDIEISFNYLIPTFILKKGVPSIAWVHGPIWDISKKTNPLLFLLQKRSFKKAKKIVAIAKETQNSIISLYPQYNKKTIIINNGYNYEKMQNMSKELKLQFKKFEFLYCNRLDDNKNPMLLLNAAILLSKKTKLFHINILGKGKLKLELEKMIKKSNLIDNVTIVGFVKNPYPYIKNSNVICITSKSEGFSTTIIEGLSFGKPFISTSGGVSDEIKEYNCGVIADTSEELCEEMFDIMMNNRKYSEMCSNCYKASKKYSLQKQVKNTEMLIDSLLKI